MDLHLFLEEFLKSHQIERALEFGSGKSTGVLCSKCKRVISIDTNPFSIVVPVTEQKSFNLNNLPSLKKPSNLNFLCEDVLNLNMKEPTFYNFEPQLVVFDIGMDCESKNMYQVCYERLKSNIPIPSGCFFVADNSDMQPVKDFANYLSTYEGYEVKDHGVQFIARKG